MVLVKKGWKPSRILAALLLVTASAMPLLTNQKATAYGTLPTRAIKMSNSTPGATDVIYEVNVTVGSTSENLGGLVIDFCKNTPIIQDTCDDLNASPSGFDLDPSNLSINNQTGLGASNFTIDTTNSTSTKLVLTRAVPAPVTGFSFTLGSGSGDGITNPNDLDSVLAGIQPGSFYARMVTYTTATGAQNYLSTGIGAEPPVIDAGGIALSTANQITVTAKVQERLEFCVYTSAYTSSSDNNCENKDGVAINLGDANGVLDPNNPYINKNDTKYSVSTNASGNVIIRMKGNTLTSSSNTIDAVGGTESQSNANEQFGMCTYVVDGTGLTPDDVYDGAAGAPSTPGGECASTTHNSGAGVGTGADNGAYFAFDTNTTDGTDSTYGDDIAVKTAGDFSTGALVFIGNITNTTEAGIYLTTLTFIATGTY